MSLNAVIISARIRSYNFVIIFYEDSSVTIVTTLREGRLGFRRPAEVTEFLLLRDAQTLPSLGNGGSFIEGKAAGACS